MKKTKYAKLKRSLLVRFIRWAYKCLDNLFKRKKSTFRPTNRARRSSQAVDRFNRSAHLDERPVENFNRSARLDERLNDELITVGELFGRVKWQSPEKDSQKEIFNVSKISKPHDVSLN